MSFSISQGPRGLQSVSMSVVQPPQAHLRRQAGRLVSQVVARKEWLGGISRGHLSNLIARGEIPTVRVGRRRMIDTRDLETFIRTNREIAGESSLESASPALAGDSATRDQLDNGQGSSPR
jgi:excisionase family DNA binding protein